MTDSNALMALERKFWTEGETFYRKNVDAECLIAFAEMAGVMSNKDIAATVKEPNRWSDVHMDMKGLIEPAEGIAILSYEAHATRANGEKYDALVSSGYVARDDGWKMTFHQQTPLTNGTGASETTKEKKS